MPLVYLILYLFYIVFVLCSVTYFNVFFCMCCLMYSHDLFHIQLSYDRCWICEMNMCVYVMYIHQGLNFPAFSHTQFTELSGKKTGRVRRAN